MAVAYVVRKKGSYWHRDDLEPGNHIEIPVGEAKELRQDGWLEAACVKCSDNIGSFVYHPISGKTVSAVSMEIMNRRLKKGRSKVNGPERLKPGTRIRFKYHKSPGGRMLTNMVGTIAIHDDVMLQIITDDGGVVEYTDDAEINTALKELEVMYI